jgi:hypothetical protein
VDTKTKAAGLCGNRAAQDSFNAYLTLRLAEAKRLLVSAYCLGALTFHESEGIAERLRHRFPEWVRA